MRILKNHYIPHAPLETEAFDHKTGVMVRTQLTGVDVTIVEDVKNLKELPKGIEFGYIGKNIGVIVTKHFAQAGCNTYSYRRIGD